MSRYALYWPTDRGDLLAQFPELRKIPAIQNLAAKPKELLFVWFYACKSSPAVKLHGEKARLNLALRAVHGDPIPEPYASKHANGIFPPEVAEAITAMRKFEPGANVRMRLLYERMMENSIKLVDIDVETLKVKDWTEQKNYLMAVEKSMAIVAMAKTGIEGLQGIVLVGEEEEPEGVAHARIAAIPTPQL